ncbi:hypothetical protein EJ04DRAFT_477406, partial [Polyplosphaeria fusca]
MDLLDLPPEVLDEIIAQTLPFGLESFALSCKTVWQRAASAIKRHNELKAQWKHAVIHPAGTLSALFEILHDPLAAHYIEHLDVWDAWSGRDLEARRDTDISESMLESLQDMVTRSQILAQVGVDVNLGWEKTKKDESDEPSVLSATLLFLSLPNLRSLRLSPTWSHINLARAENPRDRGILAMLENIVRAAGSQNDQYPLSKLETLLPFRREGYEERTPLQSLNSFMVLKNMKNLYAVSCVAVDDGYTGLPFKWQYSISSPLTRIELASCCMDADGISALVSHTPQLRVFRYSHQTKWHGCQYDWNAGTFIEAVYAHCGNTIIDLAVTIDTLYGEIENGASSLLGFPHLEYLEVDVLVFCGPPVESGQTQGLSSVLPDGVKPWTKDDIPCIGSMLPTSIREVQINTDFPEPDEAGLKALLKDFRQQRAQRLTGLRKAVLRQPDTDGARSVADFAGADLEVFSTDGSSRMLMPAWKREFDRKVGGIV